MPLAIAAEPAVGADLVRMVARGAGGLVVGGRRGDVDVGLGAEAVETAIVADDGGGGDAGPERADQNCGHEGGDEHAHLLADVIVFPISGPGHTPGSGRSVNPMAT